MVFSKCISSPCMSNPQCLHALNLLVPVLEGFISMAIFILVIILCSLLLLASYVYYTQVDQYRLNSLKRNYVSVIVCYVTISTV